VDVPRVIRHCLKELVDQKDLAAAAQVTESHISQLLARKKSPPTSSRTDSTRRWAGFEAPEQRTFAKLADLQRQENFKKRVAEPASPLLAVGRPKRFEFVEREPEEPFGIEPGLENGQLRSIITGSCRILGTLCITVLPHYP
jgi:hypothetical protein